MKKSDFSYISLNENEHPEKGETHRPQERQSAGIPQTDSASDSSPVKRDIKDIIETFGHNIDSDRDVINISTNNDDTITTVSSINTQRQQHVKSIENKARYVQFSESVKNSDKKSVSTIYTTGTTNHMSACENSDSTIDTSLQEQTEYNNRHVWNCSTYMCQECQNKFSRYICNEFHNKRNGSTNNDIQQTQVRRQTLDGLIPKQQVVYNNCQLLHAKTCEPSSFDIQKKQVVFVDPIYKRHKYYEFGEHDYTHNQNCQDNMRNQSSNSKNLKAESDGEINKSTDTKNTEEEEQVRGNGKTPVKNGSNKGLVNLVNNFGHWCSNWNSNTKLAHSSPRPSGDVLPNLYQARVKHANDNKPERFVFEMTPDQQCVKKDVHKESKDIHQQTEEVLPQNLPSLQDKGTQDYKVQQPLPPERIDVYYFDHGNSGYFQTTDRAPPLCTELLVERTDDYATKFWAEIFGACHIAATFVTTFILQLYRFLLYSIVRPLIVGFIQLTSDYFFKPLLTITFNGVLQPIFILLYNLATSFRDLCEPIARAFGFFLNEIANLLRAIRLVEINNNTRNGPFTATYPNEHIRLD